MIKIIFLFQFLYQCIAYRAFLRVVRNAEKNTIYNRNADTPLTMVTLTGILVLSDIVAPSLQFPECHDLISTL